MIPIFKPYMPNNIMSELENILYSGKLAYGNYGKQFEAKLAEYIGNPYVLSVSNYNQAMLMALSILDLKSGDEVIASPISCLASNQPFINKGIKVIWADVDPNTGTLCVEDVSQKITSKTKAIFHNHYCGYVGDIDAINTLAKQHGLWVVDDCVEAFGSEYNGQKLGSVGTDLSIFSFQTVRLPNTIDGGAISFASKQLYDKAIKIRDYGIDRSNFRLANGEINPDCDITQEGYGATMSEVNSFIGINQMKDVQFLLERQRKNAAYWIDKLTSYTGIKPLTVNSKTQPNYWVFGVLCENKQQALTNFRDEGWYASSVHINNNIYSIFGDKTKLKGVDEFMQRFLALPSGWWVNQE